MTIHARPAAADEALPEWRLDDLFAGRDDPRLERTFAEAARANTALAALKGAFLDARASPVRLGGLLAEGIRLYEQATTCLWAIGAYASLAASVARDDPLWSKFESDVRGRSAEIAAGSLFFTLELNALEEAEIEAALAVDANAARYEPWLRRVRLARPHELDAELERMLLDRAPALANWTRLYDETLGRLRIRAERESLTLAQALNRLSDPDPGRRRRAAGGLAQALQSQAPVLGLCLNTVALEKAVEDRWRRFDDPAAARHMADEVDAEAVRALEDAVVDRYPSISHRYYALKARLMGKRVLDHWDRNAPLEQGEARQYRWSEAKAIVLDAYADLSPVFADQAKRFFEHPWIDARPRPGKSSGAYSHPVTPDRHPYVFLNYMGERRDVLTLAHELGHAVHQTLAAPLGTLLADTPLTLAETASIFGEGLVFERLLADAPPAERRALLAGKIEDGLNTVVRQIAFHRFESRFHAERRRGELAVDDIGAIWLAVMSESLGPAVRLNPGYEVYWAYVSHFVHAPFYVYAYAFGTLLVEGLMEARRTDPTAFAPLYQDLLASGGARTYVEALRPFGLDPRRRTFWDSGCQRLERLVDEFEAMI